MLFAGVNWGLPQRSSLRRDTPIRSQPNSPRARTTLQHVLAISRPAGIGTCIRASPVHGPEPNPTTLILATRENGMASSARKSNSEHASHHPRGRKAPKPVALLKGTRLIPPTEQTHITTSSKGFSPLLQQTRQPASWARTVCSYGRHASEIPTRTMTFAIRTGSLRSARAA